MNPSDVAKVLGSHAMWRTAPEAARRNFCLLADALPGITATNLTVRWMWYIHGWMDRDFSGGAS
jgi:hypothetical protein